MAVRVVVVVAQHCGAARDLGDGGSAGGRLRQSGEGREGEGERARCGRFEAREAEEDKRHGSSKP